MTDTIGAVTADEVVDQQQLAEQLLAQARTQGIDLVGPGGLLNQITKRVLEAALEAEMSEHLGYDKHEYVGRDGGNSRNGVRSKTVLTEIGPVQIDVPRDTDASFDPQIVKKRQRRLTGVDQIVLSLTARGLTTGEISAHFAEVYGASVSRDTISKITDKVVDEMNDWFNRPLDRVYPVIFIDAIVVKVRDGQVRNKPMYVVIGVTVNGERDILEDGPIAKPIGQSAPGFQSQQPAQTRDGGQFYDRADSQVQAFDQVHRIEGSRGIEHQAPAADEQTELSVVRIC